MNVSGRNNDLYLKVKLMPSVMQGNGFDTRCIAFEALEGNTLGNRFDVSVVIRYRNRNSGRIEYLVFVINDLRWAAYELYAFDLDVYDRYLEACGLFIVPLFVNDRCSS